MKSTARNKCNASSHRLLKDKAKDRVSCLQGMLTDLQSARKESRMVDISVLEEQVHLMLREWNAELNEPSPASSLNGGSLGSFADIGRLLQLKEEEDDATSPFAGTPTLKPDPDAPSFNVEDMMKEFCVNQQQEDVFQGFDQCKGSASGFQQTIDNNPVMASHLDYNQDVGIPECEGAATTRSPWNATELFDLNLLEGETIREWLFFDKPRRAFESGNRKQRSLPDYSGRGWHESRKQVVKEFGGQKRSYYMDPQPQNNLEWHLFEYEINGCDVCALYRLELKLADAKKSPKGKLATNDSLADLQKKMGRLTAEVSPEARRSGKGKTRAGKEDAGNVVNAQSQMTQTSGNHNHHPADN